jgi:hypothetical protein
MSELMVVDRHGVKAETRDIFWENHHSSHDYGRTHWCFGSRNRGAGFPSLFGFYPALIRAGGNHCGYWQVKKDFGYREASRMRVRQIRDCNRDFTEMQCIRIAH